MRSPAMQAARNRLRAGRILSAVPVSFLLVDAGLKLLGPPPVVESFVRLGYPPGLALALGTLEAFCLAIHLSPKTSILGAVLLTGFLGGAVATHVRVGDPLFSHVLFPCYVGGLIWGGLVVRDDRLRALIFPGNRRASSVRAGLDVDLATPRSTR